MTSMSRLAQQRPSLWCSSKAKRVLDIVLSSVVLVTAAPLMLLIALAIRATSPGPVLFRQWRSGLNERQFQLLKFRTMENRFECSGPAVTRRGDIRITPLGKWLRRWKLDELPQLVNVLRGEMSIVGPRPDLDQFWRQANELERQILALKPGLTGAATLAFADEEELLAQVPESELLGFYIRDVLSRKARLDCEYAAQANFWTDCGLVIKTIAAIFLPSRTQHREEKSVQGKRRNRKYEMTQAVNDGAHDQERMRILFITPYFPPEIGAPQTRIYEQALRLQSKGHTVSVLTTFPNYPSGVVPKEWKGLLFWKGSDRGVGVYRFWTYATPNSGFFRRILSQLSFSLLACIAALRLPPADVIIVESPPLFNGIAAMIVSWLKRAPYLFHVSDLWPETAIQLGILKNPILIWLSRRIELLSYRRAVLVLAVTEGIRESIAADVGPAKVVRLPNAVDTDFFRPGIDDVDLRKSLGLSMKKFLVLYAGTLGLGQQLDAALESAAVFQNEESNVHFVFAGDGAEKERLRRKAIELKLSNVSFAAPYSKACMPQLLNAADCVLVSLRDVPIFRAALPTKLFEAMACARPVVLAATGEAEAVVRESASGLCARPGDPQSIHDAIHKLQLRPDEAQAMGRRGREYMLAHFSRERRVEQLLTLLRRFVPQAVSVGKSQAEGRIKVA